MWQVSGKWYDVTDYPWWANDPRGMVGIVELPYELQNEFEVTVRATDSVNNTSDHSITVSVLDT